MEKVGEITDGPTIERLREVLFSSYGENRYLRFRRKGYEFDDTWFEMDPERLTRRFSDGRWEVWYNPDRSRDRVEVIIYDVESGQGWIEERYSAPPPCKPQQDYWR